MSTARKRVLHLFSNCKWTGPAEPALNLCIALRDLGVAADFACAPDAGNSINMVVETARARGIEPVLDFRLRKHRHPLWNALDQRALAKRLATGTYGLVHCHLDNDHLIASAAAPKHGIPILRSSYEGDGLPQTKRHAAMLRATRFLIEPGATARDNDLRNFAFPQDHTRIVPNAIDTTRFDPATVQHHDLGLPPEALVIGIVARMQTHRHYEDLLEAFARLHTDHPRAHLVIVGRGTHQDSVAKTPVQRLGIQDAVHFTGYIDGPQYVQTLRRFDIGVFLVPGSDGTCRAAREILAMGAPLIVTPRGMLPEIVTHQSDGLHCDGSPGGLHDALATLAHDAALRERMATAARQRAETAYALPVQARAVAEVYEQVLSNP